VSERPKVQHSKCCLVSKPTWVQIPPSPPTRKALGSLCLQGNQGPLALPGIGVCPHFGNIRVRNSVIQCVRHAVKIVVKGGRRPEAAAVRAKEHQVVPALAFTLARSLWSGGTRANTCWRSSVETGSPLSSMGAPASVLSHPRELYSQTMGPCSTRPDAHQAGRRSRPLFRSAPGRAERPQT
jgi:hypothetical protein